MLVLTVPNGSEVKRMTKVLLDGEELEEVHFHLSGEDCEYLWIRFIMKDGTEIDSYYFKGTL